MITTKKMVTVTLTLASITAFSSHVYAQAAGADADYNRAERNKQAEIKRLEAIDKPLRNDPLGNALIGGGVNTATRGIAAGAASFMKSGAAGVAVESAKQASDDK